MSERQRQKKLREDLQDIGQSHLGPALAIQRLALEVAELNEIIDILLEACAGLIDKLYQVASAHDDRSCDYDVCPEVRAARRAIAKAKGEK